MEHDRTCLFILMWKLCTKVFFSFVFRMFFTLRALFRQSLPCQHVAAAAAATSTTSAGCTCPIVLTPVLDQSYVQSSLSQATPSNKISGFAIDSWSHTPTRVDGFMCSMDGSVPSKVQAGDVLLEVYSSVCDKMVHLTEAHARRECNCDTPQIIWPHGSNIGSQVVLRHLEISWRRLHDSSNARWSSRDNLSSVSPML